MKAMQVIVAAGVLAAAVPVFAHDTIFVASLSGVAESPPNGSPGTGTAVITINDHDFTMRVQVTFSGLVGATTASHIHCCTTVAGAGTAGVATMTPTFLGFPGGVTAGSYDHTFDMTLLSSWNTAFVNAHGGSTGQAFDDLLSGIDAGKAYLNIHSTFAPGGEIRGFLQLSPVPEPQSWALMLGGLAAIGAMARRRAAA